MKSIQHKLLATYDEDIYAFWTDSFHGSSNVMRGSLLSAFVCYLHRTTGLQLDPRQRDYLEDTIQTFQLSKDKNTVYRVEFMRFIDKVWKVGSKK